MKMYRILFFLFTILSVFDVKAQDAIAVKVDSLEQDSVRQKNNFVKHKPLNINALNIVESLQGKLSGVYAMQPSGAPGAGLLLSIRGLSNPLYIIDGLQIADNQYYSSSVNFENNIRVFEGQSISPINDFSPWEIENIQVLKDATETAIYGSRGANGVVIITTKRANKAKNKLSFDFSTSIQQLGRNVEMLNADQYLQFVKESRENDLKYLPLDKEDSIELNQPLLYPQQTKVNTDWLDLITRNAPTNNFNFSFQGGKKKLQYYASMNYLTQKGIIINSAFERFNANIKLDYTINEHFSIGTTVRYSQTKHLRDLDWSGGNSILEQALIASPVIAPYDEKQEPTIFWSPTTAFRGENPLLLAQNQMANANSKRQTISVFGEYKMLDVLKFKSIVSFDSTVLNDKLTWTDKVSGGRLLKGKLIAAKRGARLLNIDNQLVTNFKDEKHHFYNCLGFFLGKNIDHNNTKESFGFKNGIPTLAEEALYQGGFSFGFQRYDFKALYNHFNYTFNDWLTLKSGLRFDFSAFDLQSIKANRNEMLSKSIGTEINLTKTKLLQNKVLDVNLVANYGVVGYPKTSMLSYGINLKSKNQRLSFSANAFDNRSKKYINIIFVVIGNNPINIEDAAVITQYTGFENSLGLVLMNRAKFQWNIQGNFTFMKSKILQQPQDEIISYAIYDGELLKSKVGGESNAFFTYQYAGVFQNGKAFYKDLSQDNKFNYEDNKIYKNGTPKGYGAVENNFRIGNFEASIFTRFSFGNLMNNANIYKKIDASYGTGNNEKILPYNKSTAYLDRWQKEGDNKEYPRISATTITPNSSFYLEDGSFLRVQNLTFAYNFTKIKHFDSIKIYADINNLFVFTKYSGFDPEASFYGGANNERMGFDYAIYPKARTFTLGIKVN